MLPAWRGSAMTVSRVVNREPRVSEETRRRVEAAISELGDVPRRAPRRKTIGVVVPDIANPFFTLVVRGAEDVAENGRHVILCNSQGDLERERQHLEDLARLRRRRRSRCPCKRPLREPAACASGATVAVRSHRPLGRGLRRRSGAGRQPRRCTDACRSSDRTRPSPDRDRR